MPLIMSAAGIKRTAIDDGKDVHDHPGLLDCGITNAATSNVGLHRNRPIPAMCDQVSPSALRIDTLKLHSGRSNETRNCSNSSADRCCGNIALKTASFVTKHSFRSEETRLNSSHSLHDALPISEAALRQIKRDA